MTEADLAAQLATRTEVVQALEQGALYALPPWPETYRVVATYGTLLNLDVRPLLRRIYAQVDAGVVGLEPKAIPDVPFMAPPDNVEHEFQGQTFKPQPQAGEPAPMQPRQPAPSTARPPQAAPDRRVPPGPRQVQAPQFRPQPQQPPPLPHQQQQPPWAPQQRGAPAVPPRGVAPQPPHQPQPRVPSGPQREARVPAPPQQPKARASVPLPTAALDEEPAKKRLPWKALIKWGVAALVMLAIAAGLWLWLAKPGGLLGSGPSSGQPGAKSSDKSAPTTDPNDPRSRKADRLPGPS